MIRVPWSRARERVPGRATLGAALLFGYGAAGVGLVFLVGGLSDTELVVALQTATAPLLLVAARATSRGRPTAIPVAVFLVVFGAGARVGATLGGSTGFRGGAILVALVGVTSTGFAASWAVLGYVGGTAWRWHRERDRIGRRELLYSCTTTFIGMAAAFVSYALFWTYFVVGVGDGGF